MWSVFESVAHGEAFADVAVDRIRSGYSFGEEKVVRRGETVLDLVQAYRFLGDPTVRSADNAEAVRLPSEVSECASTGRVRLGMP